MATAQEFQNFVKGLEHQIYSVYQSLLDQVAASELVVTNTLLKTERDDGTPEKIVTEPYEIKLKYPGPLNKNLILQLAIISWYLPPIAQFELQESLRTRCSENLNYFDLQIYLESKSLMLRALYTETHVTLRTLFGNVLTGKYRVREKDPINGTCTSKYLLRIDLYIKFNEVPAPKVRRRGYNDHGSSAPFDKKVRKKELEKEGTILQQQIETRRVEAKISLLQLKYDLLDLELGTG